jgi:hypothetical protein
MIDKVRAMFGIGDHADPTTVAERVRQVAIEAGFTAPELDRLRASMEPRKPRFMS